jgi:exonuclease SbcC
MQPLLLTLTGFCGIRDGLGRDRITLDLERLADGGALVAIAGANGRGKSTVMDNLHPFLTMPSRAAQAGPGGCSYYDQVFLPESEKDLTWSHGGRSYRSQVVIRTGSRRRTEAYLFELDEGGAWRPLKLEDGTVSDGKVETYQRCVEAICGPADTFFVSVFSAQGKRPLSAYRHGEIKSLLADLLGLEEIQALGRKAAETARLLKSQLVTLRAGQVQLADEARRIAGAMDRLEPAAASLEQAQRARTAAAKTLADAGREHAEWLARQEQGRATQARRKELAQELATETKAAALAEQGLRERDQEEQARWDRLQAGIAHRRQQRKQRVADLERQRAAGLQVLKLAPAVRRAARRLALAETVCERRGDRVRDARTAVEAWREAGHKLAAVEEKKAALEREAGQAALHGEDLARRLGLIDRVPCAGSDLQGACSLLADTREARLLLPGAQFQIRRLAEQRLGLDRELDALRERIQAGAGAMDAMNRAEQLAVRARQRMLSLSALAARSAEVQRTQESMVAVEAELASMPAFDGEQGEAETPDEIAERQQIQAARERIAAERVSLSARTLQARGRIEQALAALPATADGRGLADAAQRLRAAQSVLAAADATHLDAVRAAEGRAVLRAQWEAVAARQQAGARRLESVETGLATWLLFARCMGNEGLIALEIDDAGPTLSCLVNDLLLACYGPRFTVSISTLQETAKGEQREGFDILVHDAETGQAKSVNAMSGGERVWVNESLVRAVALYLAQHTGRRHETLFCDEADGPLDPDRKRMFMAMKREVLRIGGYEREFFVSQTPELTAMADAVIDLDELAVAAAA